MKKKEIGRSTFTKITGVFFLILSAFIFSSIYIPNMITTTSETKKLPIYSVDTSEKKVALSFDAAWGNEDTDDLLLILEKHNVKTTFFLVGGWIQRYPEDVKKIAEAGHDIGNHSEKHPHMTELSKEQNKQELLGPHNRIRELIGIEMNLFRPPYGAYNNTVIEAANELGYFTIQWDVDSLDWKDYGKESIVKTVLNHKDLKNGSIILLHNNAKYTKEALEEIIIGLKAKGYEIVPISELIHRENYYMDHTGRQILNKK